MEKLQIEKISNNDYVLRDMQSDRRFNVNMVFYDLACLPKVGDFVAMHEELLDKTYAEFCDHYQFGPIDQVFGRNVLNAKDVDCIVLKIGCEKIFLKRFFG